MNVCMDAIVLAQEDEQIQAIVEGLAARKLIFVISTATKQRVDRNAGTTKTYMGAQKEFVAWCKDRYDNEMSSLVVTESKLLLFLKDRVVGRESRKRKRGSEPHVIGVKSILNAVSAVVDLWKKQSFLKVWE